ncbi:MAG: hypothetical protein E3J70_01635 [Candidatus Heimdallarchaeota archaeon]|nr:MAG: hypothetical protein E3J70_01635 [Candidatus Heimdallarchaeota archaeon]
MPKFIRKHPWFFVGTSVILLVALALVTGIRLTVNTSVVNQLQQITMSTRTNDMFNPIIIGSDSGVMKIEITLPTLNMIDNDWDQSDIWIRLGRVSNPIESVYDWFDRGQMINEIWLWAEGYDVYCDNPSGLYYTHFYMEWDTYHTLIEDYTYVLILEFWDGDGEWHMCNDVWEWIYWFGEGPPLAMSINDQGEFPPDEEVQGWLLECDFVSFFEYQEQEGFDDTTPTPTLTPTNGNGNGNGGPIAGGWLNGYDISPSMQNWVFLILLILVLGFLGFIIFIIMYFGKKKKKKK